MTVIPLHPHLRRATGAERRFQSADLVRPVADARALEEAPSPTARTSRVVAEWLETLFGGTPELLARGTRLEGLGARVEVANDRGAECADLPSPRDVLGALVAMAEGARKKVLVPFAGVPLEMALLRRGASVLVSLYHTEAAPDVLVLDRRVPLDQAIESSCAVLAALEPDQHQRLLQRATELDIVEERDTGLSATRQRGGVLEDPGERETLAFGFEAAIFPSQELPRDGVSHADVHAMLFGGQLWAWVRGRRVTLVRSGPVLLAVQRMVSAVGALVTAWEEDRALHVRLRSGSFLVGVRRDRKDAREIALTLGCEDDGAITIPALAIEDACMPVLRVAAEVLRALVTVDRTQGRNLRIAALREEVRRLRRTVRARTKAVGFTNDDPERRRSMSLALDSEPPRARNDERAPGTLRFASRWNVVIDGLDATTTFFCGDRLVLSNERRVLALHRDDGQCLWQHEGAAQSAFLADSSVVRLGADGLVEVREIATGELMHRMRLAPRVGGAPTGVFVGGGGIPPIGLVAEGRDRLAAIDLRTGELRFRYTARSPGTFRLRRAGRLVIAVNGDGNVDAIDVVSGEVVWRCTAPAKFCLTPTTHGAMAIAVAGEPGRGDATLYGIDLLSGELVYKQPLGGPVATAPQMLDRQLVVALTGARRGVLASHEPETGEIRWAIPDPGVGTGGGVVSTDRAIFVNASSGKLVALDPQTGDALYTRVLSNPVSDDVPRKLTPLVRGGALFVPSAAVHVLRPADGSAIGAAPPCDLVPDSLHVDERGWMYVAEESGHLLALAPVQALRLVLGRS
jgi:outer membrane protein assembly factor BamB